MEWRLLPASRRAGINLAMVLCGGQCFRWHATPRATYVGIVQDRVYELRARVGGTGATTASPHGVEYRRLHPPSLVTCESKGRSAASRTRHDVLQDESFLSHYLALDVDVDALWHEWTVGNAMRRHPLVRHLAGLHDTDSTTQVTCPCNPVRHLRQDLHETLFSFVCSQNNHVRRITAMVRALCDTYGTPLCRVDLDTGHVLPCASDSSSTTSMCLHGFPTLDQLRRATEADLRKLGFGYRSRYVVQCVHTILAARRGASVLESTSSCPPQHRLCRGEPFYETLLRPSCDCATRRAALLALPGVGRKVADCVLLFALGHTELVPVDTHMAQVASAYLAEPASPTTCGRQPRAVVVSGSGWQEVLRAWRARSSVAGRRMSASSSARRRRVVVTKAPRVTAKSQRTTSRGDLAPLTDRLHDAIQAGFRELFGPHCGLAHTVLFYDRLRR